MNFTYVRAKIIHGWIVLCICGIFFSCMSAEFIRTGEESPPLGENAEVAIFTSSKPEQKYQEIGLLRVRGGDVNSRMERARLYAREKGGNGIIIREIGIITQPGTDTVIEQIGTSTYQTQEFVIIKLAGDKSIAKVEKLEEAKDDIGKGQNAESDAGMPKKAIAIDYSSLPRATYKQLINDYKSLEGKHFRGSLFPQKIYKIPSSLRANAESGDRLVLLTTKSGKNKLYLIINKNNIPEFRKKIKSGEILDFVYSPVEVYTGKDGRQPVIKFVEEISAAR